MRESRPAPIAKRIGLRRREYTMGELASATLERVEGAAKDALAACDRMREEGEGARTLSEAVCGACLGALELYRAELAGLSAEGDGASQDEDQEEPETVPVWVVDGIVEVSDAAESLAQAVECATAGVRTSITDPADFMAGTLDVLLVAAEDVYERAAALRDKAVSDFEGGRFE